MDGYLSKPVTLAALTGLLDQAALGELAGSAGGSAAGVQAAPLPAGRPADPVERQVVNLAGRHRHRRVRRKVGAVPSGAGSARRPGRMSARR